MLTEREKWLMEKAFSCGWNNGSAPTIEPYSFEDWMNDAAGDGVTVEMLLDKECPYLPYPINLERPARMDPGGHSVYSGPIKGRVMRILQLTLKKKWFDMIATGVKTEEYREIKPYWVNRFHNKKFDAVRFRNGYSKTAPEFTMELKGPIIRGRGYAPWGAPVEDVFILPLGKMI